MRSRIINTAEERIIAYKQQENLAALKKLCGKLGVKLVEVPNDAAETQIGYFAGFGGFGISEKSCEAEDGCIVFAGLSGKRIDAVLSELRKAEVIIPLKAAVTPSNQSWSIKKLLAELKSERSRMGG